MIMSQGRPLVVSEEKLREAHRQVHAKTGISVCPTGTAGLAGYLTLQPQGESAVLLTGIER